MEASKTITRQSASNLALAFVMLPREKREGMCALYAFCREVDDIADEEAKPAELRRQALAEWRQDLQRACSHQRPRFAVNQELQPVIHRYRLPFDLFHELLLGVEMDLDVQRYATHQELELYCYRVASVVGLLSIEIFGYRAPECRDYAVSLGKALQYTNILRDVGSDAARGRIYLPLSDLKQFGVSEREILEGQYSERFQKLASGMAQRARDYYRRAAESLPANERGAMVAAELMGSVYWRLLRKLERTGFNVLGPNPARIGKAHKLLLILQAWLRLVTGRRSPNYGA
jgi:phytoene synthase